MGLKYVGRTPDSDFSVVTKKYTTDRYDTIKVDNAHINQQIATQAVDLATTSYVDQQDALRARKTNVDAADANYLPNTQVGAANGLVPLTSSGMVAGTYIPSGVQTSRKPSFVTATNVFISGDQNVGTITPKEFRAATLTIPDPGFPYVPLLFAQVLGGSSLGNVVNRGMGTGSFAQLSILRQSDDTKYSWCLCSSHKNRAFHTAVPFADNTINPDTRPPITGASSWDLWLGLWSGSTYTFNATGLMFNALVFPGF